jgi:hypothetical protein
VQTQTVVQEQPPSGELEPAARDADRERWRGWLASPFVLASAVCLALAGLSAAVLPTVPSYDPWSWVVWGREVSDPHLSFFVGGGPSWKPLPVLFTAVLGLFGGAAPTLWVIVARAGGLLGLVGAYRLAARLVGGPRWATIVAGAIAVAAVLMTQDWFYYWFRGTSEPLLIGTSLWAIDRHLAGRRWTAFWLGVATGLMRPEVWPFVILYAVFLAVRDPAFRPLWARGLLLAGLVAIPFGWFVPPWVSTGQPLLAATHAQEYNGDLGAHPLLTVLYRGVDDQTAVTLFFALVAAGIAVWRRDRVVMALAALGAAWWVVVVAMTLDGYPGLERFYLPAAALACVLAGVGVVQLARLAGASVRRLGPRALGPAIAAAAVVLIALAVSLPFVTGRISLARAQEPTAALAVKRLNQLSAAVAAVGGHHGVFPCRSSFAAVNHSVQTALAWKLHVTLERVGTAMSNQGVMFVGPHDSIDGGPPAVDPRLTSVQLIAHVGVWRVYRMTTPGLPASCVGR